MTLLTQAIFKKALVEHVYVGFYSVLCANICKFELKVRGLLDEQQYYL